MSLSDSNCCHQGPNSLLWVQHSTLCSWLSAILLSWYAGAQFISIFPDIPMTHNYRFVSVINLLNMVFKKMGQPRPLFHLFSSFQTNITNFTTNMYVKKYPSSTRPSIKYVMTVKLCAR